MANTKPVIVFVLSEFIEDPKKKKNLLDIFGFILLQKRPVSVYAKIQNFFSSFGGKNLAGKFKMLSPQDSYKGDY